jgi:hypothetical protein
VCGSAATARRRLSQAGRRKPMKRLLALIVSIVMFAFTPVAMAGDGCTADCPGDVNGDNVVDFNDLLILLSEWGCTDCPDSDIDDNGVVDFQDLLLLLGDWGCGIVGPTTELSGTVTNAWTGDRRVRHVLGPLHLRRISRQRGGDRLRAV